MHPPMRGSSVWASLAGRRLPAAGEAPTLLLRRLQLPLPLLIHAAHPLLYPLAKHHSIWRVWGLLQHAKACAGQNKHHHPHFGGP
jgi:hypothetical protein